LSWPSRIDPNQPGTGEAGIDSPAIRCPADFGRAETVPHPLSLPIAEIVDPQLEAPGNRRDGDGGAGSIGGDVAPERVGSRKGQGVQPSASVEPGQGADIGVTPRHIGEGSVSRQGDLTMTGPRLAADAERHDDRVATGLQPLGIKADR
jgi:hypothetical protein